MNRLGRRRPLFNDFSAEIVRLWWTAGLFNFVLLVILAGYLAIAEQWETRALLGFALIGSGGGWFFWRAVRGTLDYRRFGKVDILPHKTAARPGGKLGVTLQFARQPPAIAELEATLRCETRTYFHDPYKGVKLIGPIEAIWSESRRFVLARRHGSARCVAEFDLPADAKPSDLPQESCNAVHPPGDYAEHPPKDSIEVNSRRTFHAWRITFTAGLPGVDFQRTYRVSVDAALDPQ